MSVFLNPICFMHSKPKLPKLMGETARIKLKEKKRFANTYKMSSFGMVVVLSWIGKLHMNGKIMNEDYVTDIHISLSLSS